MNSPKESLIGEVLNNAAERMEKAGVFFGHGTDNAWDEACLLLFDVLDVPPDVDESIANEPFPFGAKERFEQLLSTRISEKAPMAYLLGKAWYAGYPFVVSPSVLVPRSPLAELIEKRFSPWFTGKAARILDLCAGSGCLGILCAHHFPEAKISLGELSSEAIEIARQNIAMHGLDDRIEVYESDLFASIPSARFDIIVSNPPYVDKNDFDSMPQEFKHEPELGLISGDDGLDITRCILAEGESWLTDEGILVVEVGNSWPALEKAYPDVPFTWLEMERGGEGIFVLSAAELRQFRESFQGAYNRRAK